MIILDFLDKHPESEESFRRLDDITGDCVLCTHIFDDMDEFFKKYNIDKGEFLNSFNDLTQ